MDVTSQNYNKHREPIRCSLADVRTNTAKRYEGETLSGENGGQAVDIDGISKTMETIGLWPDDVDAL